MKHSFYLTRIITEKPHSSRQGCRTHEDMQLFFLNIPQPIVKYHAHNRGYKFEPTWTTDHTTRDYKFEPTWTIDHSERANDTINIGI